MANQQPVAQPTPPTEAAPHTAPAASQPAVPAATAAPVDTSPRNYLAVVALAAFMGQYGLARWYRGDELGKIRFWIAVGCTVTSVVPYINIVSLLGLFVLSVWGVVDFFLLTSTTADANGTPYIATERDKTWAQGLKIAYIVWPCLGGSGDCCLLDFASSWSGYVADNKHNGAYAVVNVLLVVMWQ